MDYLILALTAFGASLLTFFSGFGLGTLLLPAFTIFFPVELAIALTGIVHFLNNLFKIALVGRYTNKPVLLRFGITSVLGALIGALVLMQLANTEPIIVYYLGTHLCSVTWIKLTIAVAMIFFAVVEIVPGLVKMQFAQDKLPLGGLISGFFGGLSGHQGALRSAFLVKCNLTKESFIATGVMIACFVDITRLSVYSRSYFVAGITDHLPLLGVSVAAAFVGALLGSKLLKKVTLSAVQKMVTVMIFVLAIVLGSGLI